MNKRIYPILNVPDVTKWISCFWEIVFPINEDFDTKMKETVENKIESELSMTPPQLICVLCCVSEAGLSCAPRRLGSLCVS